MHGPDYVLLADTKQFHPQRHNRCNILFRRFYPLRHVSQLVQIRVDEKDPPKLP